MSGWAPTLDFLAVILPTLLAIVGVLVTIEAPKLESSSSRIAWRLGLISFGLIVSIITYMQQHVAKEVADKFTTDQVNIAKEQLALNYVPTGALLYQNKRFEFYNNGKTNLFLHGDKIGGEPKTIDETRIIAPAAFYYIFADKFEEYVYSIIGFNGERRLPFEMYFKNQLGEKYTSKFELYIIVKDAAIEVHTQMLSFNKEDW